MCKERVTSTSWDYGITNGQIVLSLLNHGWSNCSLDYGITDGRIVDWASNLTPSWNHPLDSLFPLRQVETWIPALITNPFMYSEEHSKVQNPWWKQQWQSFSKQTWLQKTPSRSQIWWISSSTHSSFLGSLYEAITTLVLNFIYNLVLELWPGLIMRNHCYFVPQHTYLVPSYARHHVAIRWAAESNR